MKGVVSKIGVASHVLIAALAFAGGSQAAASVGFGTVAVTGLGGSPGEGGDAGGGPGVRSGDRGPPNVRITDVPRTGAPGRGTPCIDHGFRANLEIQSNAGVRRVSAFLDGKLIKQSASKQFSIWVSVVGLRAGSNTIRAVAVDRKGRRDVASRSFLRCAPYAAPSPDFGG